MRRSIVGHVLVLACVATVIAPWAVSDDDVTPGIAEELDAARNLYQRSKLEKLLFTTDPMERGEVRVARQILEQQLDAGDTDYLFNLGDEAFEAELDRRFGMGAGDGGGQRLQRGELGGLDSGSCRACHFRGGPDGSGSFSSVAMMRSDGATLSSALLRDAPHVMGLGYVEIVAGEMTAELQEIARELGTYARATGEASTRELVTKGVNFGRVTARPDGTIDASEVQHIAPDLIVRPFGHKGRARSLVEFSDEAMQMHHGVQSESRLTTFEGRAHLLGAGPSYDADGDGVAFEATAAQAVLLSLYLSMLPVPVIHPPTSGDLALAWGRGRTLFGDVGCDECHRPSLRFQSAEITHESLSDSTFRATLDLSVVGQEPVPRQLDYGADDDGGIPNTTPIYAFTDLRLHDMGPDLAEPEGERVADGSWTVPGNLWLTRSLWGLADTAPYLHDGRATTIADAIRGHGGDATSARDAFDALSLDERRAVLVFLTSLTREPTVLVE